MTDVPFLDMLADTATPEELGFHREKLRVMDIVVRLARDEGWCDDVIYALEKVYGDSPWSDGVWRDSDGVDCHGISYNGFNIEGYNSKGFHRDGTYNAAMDMDFCCARCNPTHVAMREQESLARQAEVNNG